MAALDFPASPTVGQVFNAWTFDGVKWDLTGGGSVGSDGYTFIQDTEPGATAVGQTWYDTSVGLSFVWFDGFWVQTSPGNGGGGVQAGSWNTKYEGASAAYTNSAQVLSLTVPVQKNRKYLIIARAECLESAYAGGRMIGLKMQLVGLYSYGVSVFPTVAGSTLGNDVVYTRTWEPGSLSGDRVFQLQAYNSAGGSVWITGGTYGGGPTLTVVDITDLGSGAGGLTVTPWTAVTFQNSWANIGGGRQVVEYRKVGDEVQVRGQMQGGTVNQTAFTLPIGFRPPKLLDFIGRSGDTGGTGIINVDADGTCKFYSTTNTLTACNFKFSVSL